jgi:hypothetical protein
MNDRVAEGQDAPLLPPWPSVDFEALSRRQSIVAWTIGAVIGIALAAVAILALAL